MALNTQDILEIKKTFPIFTRQINGHPLVYLDTANSAQKPQIVIDEISKYYSQHYANVHRGVHTLSCEATLAFDNVRKIVQNFINAPSEKEIIFTKSATEAINLVAQTYGMSHLKDGDVILVSEMEHHSNIVPWQLLQQYRKIEIKMIPILDSGELDMATYKELLNIYDVKLVAITHLSNALGTITPIAKICKLAKAKNAITIVDGCQAAMHLSIDVQAIGCDFYVFSSHKIYGPTGAGVLWGKSSLLKDKMPPYQGGGEMIKRVSFKGTSFADIPHKFEAGTPPIVQVIGMGKAIEFIQAIGLENIQAYESQLLSYATDALKNTFPELRLLGEAPEKAAILSFTFGNIHAHDIATVLDSKGIAVRAGHHCAQPVMDHYKVNATIRASLGLYNSEADIEALVDGLKTVKEFFKL